MRRAFAGMGSQVGPAGIRVNGVMPGVIDGHFNDAFDNAGATHASGR